MSGVSCWDMGIGSQKFLLLVFHLIACELSNLVMPGKILYYLRKLVTKCQRPAAKCQQQLRLTEVPLRNLHKALPSTTLYCKACTKHCPVLLCTTKLAHSTFQYYYLYYKACTKHFPVLLCTTDLAQVRPSIYYFVLQSLHKESSYTQQVLSQRSFYTHQAF